nr:perlucin-like [Aedes albopictus]
MGRFMRLIFFVFVVIGTIAYGQKVKRIYESENFFVTNEKLNWFGAVEYCEGRGMRLAVIDTLAKKNEVLALLQVSYLVFNPVKTLLWMGASDLAHEGRFTWHGTGKAVADGYSNWYPGEPDGLGVEHCAAIHHEPAANRIYNWYDVRCTEQYFFVCEK